MHLLGGADNGVGRTDLATAAAADAQFLGHYRDFGAVIGQTGQIHFDAQLGGDRSGQRLATGWAASRRSRTVGNRCRGSRAAGESALTAVGAGHHGQQFFYKRIAFNLQKLVGNTENNAEDGTKQGNTEDGCNHGESPLHTQTRKAHEGQGQQADGDKRNGRTGEGTGHSGQRNAFAQAGKNEQDDSEAKR